MASSEYIQESINLGSDRYVNVNQELDVLFIDKESQKRAFFSGTRWARFVMEMKDIDAVVQHACDGKLTSLKQHYGGAWYVSVNDRVSCIDLRRWFEKHEGSILPTRNGIALTYRQWDALKKAVERLHNELPALTAISPCWHDGQLDMMNCCECSPFGPDDQQSCFARADKLVINERR